MILCTRLAAWRVVAAAWPLAFAIASFPDVAPAAADVAVLSSIHALEDRRSLGSGKLVALLGNSDAEVRAAAARALGRIGDESSVAALVGAIEDRDPDVRREVVFALGQLGKPEALDALKRVAASNAAADERREAVLALGKVTGKSASSAILPFLADPNPAVRGDAALALARTADSLAASDLKPLLADADATVRARAAWAAGRLKARDLAVSLRPLVNDAAPEVRLAATKAIADVEDAGAVADLAKVVGDADWRVRVNVATALGKTRSRDAIANLAKLGKDANVHVRAAAAAALEFIPYHYTRDDLLFALEKDVEPEVRGATMNVFAVGQENRPEAVVEHFTSCGDSSQFVVGRAFESFADASRRMADGLPLGTWRGGVSFYMNGRLKNEQAPLTEKIHAAYNLGAFDVAEPWPRATLLTCLEKHPWAITAAAIHGLGELVPADADQRRRHIEQTPATLGEVLAKNPDAAKHTDIRLAIAEALGNFDTPDSKRILAQLILDPDFNVRNQAAESSEKLGLPRPTIRPAGELPGAAEPLAEDYVKSRAGRFTAVVKTSRGTFEIELLHREAPRTVQNFVTLAEKGFYDGTSFHRVVPNFVAQGGCPIGNGWGDPGYTIRCETSPLRYERGTVGMAHAGKDTGGSQFFVAHSPQPHLDGRYTIFGKVVKGMEVVDEIRIEDVIESVKIKKKIW